MAGGRPGFACLPTPYRGNSYTGGYVTRCLTDRNQRFSTVPCYFSLHKQEVGMKCL